MALTPIQLQVVKTLTQRGLTGGDARAYPTDRYKKGVKTTVTVDRVKMTPEDGEALTDAGLASYTDQGTLHWNLTVVGIRLGLTMVEHAPLDVQALLEDTLNRSYFHPDEEGVVAIPAIYKAGSSRLVLVLGENAGGKSFFRRITQGMTFRGGRTEPHGPDHPPGPFPVREFIHLSMEGRTKSGFVSSAVYGTENWASTGENSSRTVTKGIETVTSRAHTTIIYWDEPDIGMSAGTAAGVGIALRQFIEAQENPLIEAVYITSHSPALVKQLAGLDPHYLYLGNADGPPDLEAWMGAQTNPVPVMPEDLQAASVRRFRLIQKHLDRRKAEKTKKTKK